jgi:transcriptional regulator with XRE-family HTH domain
MKVTPTLNHAIQFGQILRKRRNSLGLTLEELASRFDVAANDLELFEQDIITGSEAERKILLHMYCMFDLL